MRGSNSFSCACHGKVGQYGFQDEVISLKRDKNVLMMELVRLRQKHQVVPINTPHFNSMADGVADTDLQSNEKYIRRLTEQLNRTEERVAALMEFLAMAMKNSVMMSSGMAGAAKDFLRMGEIMQDRGPAWFLAFYSEQKIPCE